MFYKIEKGKDLFNQIVAIFLQAKIERAVIAKWAEDQGAKDYIAYRRGLVNPPVGVVFEGAPPAKGWKYNKQHNYWRPDNSREGAALKRQIEDLPKMGKDVLAKAIDFETYEHEVGGRNMMVFCPEVYANPEYVIVKYPDGYNGTIPADLEEITASEYKNLMP